MNIVSERKFRCKYNFAKTTRLTIDIKFTQRKLISEDPYWMAEALITHYKDNEETHANRLQSIVIGEKQNSIVVGEITSDFDIDTIAYNGYVISGTRIITNITIIDNSIDDYLLEDCFKRFVEVTAPWEIEGLIAISIDTSDDD